MKATPLGRGARPPWLVGRETEELAGHRSPCPKQTVLWGSSEGEEAKAARLRGEGENKTRAGESPDLTGSDPQGLTVNGDS